MKTKDSPTLPKARQHMAGFSWHGKDPVPSLACGHFEANSSISSGSEYAILLFLFL